MILLVWQLRFQWASVWRLVVGVITNYLATPVGDPVLLFVGVAFVAIAIIIDAIAYGKLPSSSNDTSKTKGLVLSIIAGIAMGFFYRFVAASMATDFVNPEIGKLTPYTALVLFSIGLLVSNFVFVTIIMYKPFSGEKVVPMDYFKKGNLKLHTVGILGGIIWSIGMSLSIIASSAAGLPYPMDWAREQLWLLHFGGFSSGRNLRMRQRELESCSISCLVVLSSDWH